MTNWKIPISITLEKELLDEIDKVRKDVPRSLFLRTIIIKALKLLKSK